jgi:DNA-binding beta-propeller fold protein YncE
MIYGVDESVRGIFRVPISGGLVEWYIPKHPSFLTPEGIAWHPVLNRLLVTDDTSGNIFSVDFGNTLEVFANKKIGLSQPEAIVVMANGSVLVTDNDRGEILHLNINGSVLNRIVFHRMYRYLQGVAMDYMNNIYVATADGLGSVSFIPSYVFKITSFW